MSTNDFEQETAIQRLLEGEADLPDVTGDFHLTVDGVPLCLVDRALLGDNSSECQYSSLNDSVADCLKLQEIFPAATVGVFLGECPNQCARRVA